MKLYKKILIVLFMVVFFNFVFTFLFSTVSDIYNKYTDVIVVYSGGLMLVVLMILLFRLVIKDLKKQ